MRIPTREVLFIGQNRCPEFDCHQEPPPEELNVLLAFLMALSGAGNFKPN
jgi:hypothetical protein